MADVQAWIAGPTGTPFAGGVFRVQLKLGNDFPQAPPKGWYIVVCLFMQSNVSFRERSFLTHFLTGYFLTKIFHPNIAPTGEICVNTLKRDWTSNLTLQYVLLTIKSLLFTPNPDSALNEEAAMLFHDNVASYERRAAVYTSVHAKNNAAKVTFRNPVGGEFGSLSMRQAVPLAATKLTQNLGQPTVVGGGGGKSKSRDVSTLRGGDGMGVQPMDIVGTEQVLGASNGRVSPKGKAAVAVKRSFDKVGKLDKAKADKKRMLRRI